MRLDHEPPPRGPVGRCRRPETPRQHGGHLARVHQHRGKIDDHRRSRPINERIVSTELRLSSCRLGTRTASARALRAKRSAENVEGAGGTRGKPRAGQERAVDSRSAGVSRAALGRRQRRARRTERVSARTRRVGIGGTEDHQLRAHEGKPCFPLQHGQRQQCSRRAAFIPVARIGYSRKGRGGRRGGGARKHGEESGFPREPVSVRPGAWETSSSAWAAFPIRDRGGCGEARWLQRRRSRASGGRGRRPARSNAETGGPKPQEPSRRRRRPARDHPAGEEAPRDRGRSSRRRVGLGLEGKGAGLPRSCGPLW